MSNHKPSNPKPANPRPPIDPLVAQRLQQMNARNRTGTALPPPHPGTVRPGAAAPKAVPAPNGPVTAEQAAKLEAAAQRAAAARAAKQGGTAVPTAANPGRRVKPARASKMGALALSVATTAGLAAMFAGQDTGTTDSVVLTGGTVATVAPTATTAATASTEAATTTAGDTLTSAAPTTTVAAAAPATILDGTYLGAADSNRWGVVQVQAVYSGGQLVDVQILQYPDGDNKSVRINQRSLPTLISEAISAQSADVNTVSGATYTSNSYKASLQSAIDAAKSASGIAG